MAAWNHTCTHKFQEQREVAWIVALPCLSLSFEQLSESFFSRFVGMLMQIVRFKWKFLIVGSMCGTLVPRSPSLTLSRHTLYAVRTLLSDTFAPSEHSDPLQSFTILYIDPIFLRAHNQHLCLAYLKLA